MTDHPLTDKMCRIIAPHILFNASTQGYEIELECDNMRAAYDVGYAQALEDLQDVITSIQRKDSPSIPITLNELKDL